MPDGARGRVLVVEDEILVALLVVQYLEDLGYEVVGPATRLAPAMELARRERIDFAVLDINLAGQPSFPVADILKARGAPFLFATGYGSAGLNDAHASAVTVQKPFDLDDLKRAIRRAVP